MRSVAEQQGVSFNASGDAGRTFVDSPLPMLRSLWLRHVLGLSFDRTAQLHGYHLLVGGMHLPRRGGLIAADLNEAWWEGEAG